MSSIVGILLLFVLTCVDVFLWKAPILGMGALVFGAPALGMRAVWRWATHKRAAAGQDAKRVVWCVLACVVSVSGGVLFFQTLEEPVRKAGDNIHAHAKASGSLPESLQQIQEGAIASRATGPTTVHIHGVPVKYVVNASKNHAYLVYWSYGYIGQITYDISEQRFTAAPAD